MVPDLLTRPLVKGSETPDTCGDLSSFATRDSTSVLLTSEVSFCPLGASNTTRAVAPSAEACGNSFSSRSIAFCDCVPGTLNAPEDVPGALMAPMPMAARTATHSITTMRRRRNDSRPSR
jgi:hypothetical protein